MNEEKLYEEIREVASKSIWAKGLQFARRNDVKASDENCFVVIEAAKAADYQVRTDPVELDWNCSCLSKEDPCEHVVATVVALKMQREKGIDIEDYSSSKFKVVYSFERALNKSLVLKRVLERDDELLLIKHSILPIVSGRIEGPSISAQSFDLEIDRVLSGDYGARIDGFVSSSRAWNMMFPHLQQLTESKGLKYRDKVVFVNNSSKASDLIELTHEAAGFRIQLVENPNIVEEFSNGVCLFRTDEGLEIRRLSQNDLPNSITNELKSGRFFSMAEKVELFSSIIPQLKKRFEFVEFGVEEKATYEIVGFCVKNKIVGPRKVETSFHLAYGDPVKAYLEGTDFVCLGDTVPLRQFEKESKKRRQFERDFGLELSRIYEYEEENLFSWVNKVTRLRFPFIGDDLENLRVLGHSPILTKLLDDEVNFCVEIEGDEYEVAPEDLMDIHEKESKYLKTSKGYLEVSYEWLDEYKDLIRSFIVSKKGKQKRGVAALERMRILEGFGFKPPKKLQAYKQNLFASNRCADLSKTNADLRPYQIEGVNWLTQLQSGGLGALLADDMGLGKTLQSIATFSSRTLVVCPTSLVFNWKNELSQFRPDLSVSVFHGPQRKISHSSDVIITTYGILRSDVGKLSNIAWKIICIDEAQVIKNPNSKAAQALADLNGDFKLALTGTPIENHYKDLWSIFNFITPGLLGELNYFEKFVVKPIQQQSKTALRDLKGRVNPFILRRTKKAVLLELPEKTEVINYCELTEDQGQEYEQYLSGVRTKVTAGEVKPIQIFELILRLRQFACDPRLVNSKYKGGSGKLEVFKNLIMEVTQGDHKSLVFSQWTSFLDLIQVELDKLDILTYRLDGSTKNREKIVSSYNSEKKACVFLLSLKAGGVGLNLTSADHVFLMDPWWNPATERQAIDRAHRIGQKNPVMIHRLVGKSTIEEKVVKLQKIKEEMSNMVLEDMDSAAISREDLLQLLE